MQLIKQQKPPSTYLFSYFFLHSWRSLCVGEKTRGHLQEKQYRGKEIKKTQIVILTPLALLFNLCFFFFFNFLHHHHHLFFSAFSPSFFLSLSRVSFLTEGKREREKQRVIERQRSRKSKEGGRERKTRPISLFFPFLSFTFRPPRQTARRPCPS